MKTLTARDWLIVYALLMCVPCLAWRALRTLWPDNLSGEENMDRRLHQLCEAGLLVRHTGYAQEAEAVELFYFRTPDMPPLAFGEYAWELAKRWERVPAGKVVFFTAGERAAKHYGRTVTNPLKSASALSHNINLGAAFLRLAVLHPDFVRCWVSEELIASARGRGEKVIDAAIVDSTGSPALGIEMAGASYAASNGERLREIDADCVARGLPYEVWTVAGGKR
jgi:hypothetical protein